MNMEAIVGVPMRPPINLKTFLEEYQAVFKPSTASSSSSSPSPIYKIPVTDLNIQEAMKLSNNSELFKEIEANCKIDLLKSPNDPRITEFIPGYTELPRTSKHPINSDIKLETVQELIKFKNSTQKNPFQRSTEIYSMIKLPILNEEEKTKQLDYEPGEELKIYVRVYRPARATHENRTLEKPVFAQEFECLGSNYLTELRDKIQCVCNNKRFFDISEAPETPLPTKETDPGYFFITDTFYNDQRNPLNADYSQHIRNWAKTAAGYEKIQFKTANMENTRFIDLTISLGFPQHYQHHGNCEHVFVFSQVEVITTPATQALPRSYYPRLKSYNHYNNRVCNTCGILPYVYVVKDSNRQVYDPAYLCKKCFLSYHYIDGKKIGDFKAYRLFDSTEQQQQQQQHQQPKHQQKESSSSLVQDQDEDEDEDEDEEFEEFEVFEKFAEQDILITNSDIEANNETSDNEKEGDDAAAGSNDLNFMESNESLEIDELLNDTDIIIKEETKIVSN